MMVTYLDDFVGVIINTSKVKLTPDMARPVVNVICQFVDGCNSMPELSRRFCGMDLADIPIQVGFIDCVLPDSVRYDNSSFTSADLLIREKVDISTWDEEKFFEYHNAVRKLEAWYKKDGLLGTAKSLKELRTKAGLRDVDTRFAVSDGDHKWVCVPSDTPYWPIPLARTVKELYSTATPWMGADMMRRSWINRTFKV